MKSKSIFITIVGLLALGILVFQACKKVDSITEEENPQENGLILTKHLIETEIPCFINIMLQVSDMDGNGVDSLVVEDFELQENNQTISYTESAMTIKNKDAVPYQLKTVLMIDNSTSADLSEIKNAAITLVNNIINQQEIAIYVFSEEAILLQDFTSDKNTIINVINTISTGNTATNLYGSVIQGASRWEDAYSISNILQGTMILITDGSNTQGSSTLNSTLNAVGGKRIYTVGLGNVQDENALKQLGTAGYYSLTDYSQLSNIFTDIQNKIVSYTNSFYWLYYMSPSRGNNDHTLGIYVKENVNTSSNAHIDGSFNSKGFYSVMQGVVLNNGINSLNLNPGDSYNFTVTTYLPSNTPDYSWQSSDEEVISVNVNPENNANATITASGYEGQSAGITVTDQANSLSKSIVVYIKEQPLGQFTDSRDGQIYNIVTIGDQTWFAQNLNFESSNSWCYGENENSCNKYGRLYTWSGAVNACPDGWHLPTDDEWKILEMHLGMSQSEVDGADWRGTDEGKKLKNTIGWSSNGNGTDEVGFSALPGGYRYKKGYYHNAGSTGYWWSATANGSIFAWYRYLFSSNDRVNLTYDTKDYSFSVRCVKDY